MYTKVACLGLLVVCLVESLPTVYKYNENKILEPDLIPVSSTVIPLPVYQVSYSINVNPSLKDEKTKKPEGPISLVTVYNKKKAVEPIKLKTNDVSIVREVSKKNYDS